MESHQQSVIRRRRTRAEVQHILAEFLSSGMNLDEFCRSHGVCRSTLYRYLGNKHNQQKSAPATQLVPVELVDVCEPTFDRSTGLAVVVRNGRKIEVGQGFDPGTLERLLSVVEKA
jgi:transposase-like protein